MIDDPLVQLLLLYVFEFIIPKDRITLTVLAHTNLVPLSGKNFTLVSHKFQVDYNKNQKIKEKTRKMKKKFFNSYYIFFHRHEPLSLSFNCRTI